VLVAVAGGNLQGVEVVYLARKAGWEVLLMDRNSGVPASGLCDRFVQLDVRREKDLSQLLSDVDLLIPALENDEALASLVRCTRDADVPFAFDPHAYAVSSSKLKSDDLFQRSGIPIPGVWPSCPMPVIVKPSRESGSSGIRIFRDSDSLNEFLNRAGGEWVVQAYIDGPTYSLEVLGTPGCYSVFQVTDLYMDESYDCKGVAAPTHLPLELVSKFETISLEIAALVNLDGLMDVEVVLDHDELRVLEIDARFPSQTPTTVFHSTGFNMIEALGNLFTTGSMPREIDFRHAKGVIYEHIRVLGGTVEFAGEHIMSNAGPLYLIEDFFGADEVITNYKAGRTEWVATLIVSGTDRSDANRRREQVLVELRRRFKLI